MIARDLASAPPAPAVRGPPPRTRSPSRALRVASAGEAARRGRRALRAVRLRDAHLGVEVGRGAHHGRRRAGRAARGRRPPPPRRCSTSVVVRGVVRRRGPRRRRCRGGRPCRRGRCGPRSPPPRASRPRATRPPPRRRPRPAAPRTAAPARARPSGSRSSAVSALSTAEPRSISTSAPSAPTSLDGVHHPHRVGPERSGLVRPAGGGDRHLRPAHLARELGRALGEAGAVRDDDDSDHGPAGRGQPSP